jgi:hypothetical protein
MNRTERLMRQNAIYLGKTKRAFLVLVLLRHHSVVVARNEPSLRSSHPRLHGSTGAGTKGKGN